MLKPSPAGLPLRFKLLFGLILLPWLTEYLEEGSFPSQPSALLTDIGISILLFVMVLYSIQAYRKNAGLRGEMDTRAKTDVLSTLGNAQSLEDTLVREIARARRWERPLSLIFFDLDGYQAINEKYGHTKGNLVIQAVGETTRSIIRNNVDSAFRYGGDEFLILLPETDKPRAYIIAQRLHDALSALNPPRIPMRSLKASLGFTQLAEGQTEKDILGHLERSMRKVKEKRRNIIFDADNFEKDLA